MEKILFPLLIILPLIAFTQNKGLEDKETKIEKLLSKLSVSLESNTQIYIDDKVLGDFRDPIPSFNLQDKKTRSNNYLNIDYRIIEGLTVGTQIESYEPLPLVSYYPGYKGTDITNYYINYKNKKWNITLGHFYEQFGSGLLLRAFEQRQLGLNNAIRGGRIKYNINEYINITALYGNNRIGFEHSKANLFGFDINTNLIGVFNINKIPRLSFGFSYVGKYEDFEPPIDIYNPDNIFDDTNFPELVNSYALRLGIDFGKLFIDTEYSVKGKDALFSSAALGLPKILEGRYFDGSAILLTTGYTVKGFGLSSTFRRLENMSFFSDRELSKPGANPFGMSNINFVPALTKQQDYSLANIYIYQAQPQLYIQNFAGQSGEIGGQIDVYYSFKKGTAIGGKYGTKLTINTSYWSLLDATFDQVNNQYNSELLKFGEKLYSDFNFEIKKKWNKRLSSMLFFQNMTINKNLAINGLYMSSNKELNANVIVAESIVKFNKGKSIRIELQHMSTKEDLKNWTGAALEYVFNRNLSLYITDIYNYGNDDKDKQIHFFNIGGNFTKNKVRIEINYGRQRGGLFCVGGVCRFVPENTGISMNINMLL
ncbi:MAG: hypothetical protein HRT66_00910 [Flavobacteriaceae bacterium]|nr:hypothetical protein [Flavobacteriaceae bacterium]